MDALTFTLECTSQPATVIFRAFFLTWPKVWVCLTAAEGLGGSKHWYWKQREARLWLVQQNRQWPLSTPPAASHSGCLSVLLAPALLHRKCMNIYLVKNVIPPKSGLKAVNCTGKRFPGHVIQFSFWFPLRLLWLYGTLLRGNLIAPCSFLGRDEEMEVLSSSPCGRGTGCRGMVGSKLLQRGFRLRVRKRFFTERVMKPWNRGLDCALNNML